MSKINLHNYEAYLLDYFESNLSKEESMELKQFLILHPELDIDLNEIELPVLDQEGINFKSKENLKKTDVYSADEEILNYLENKLDAKHKKEIEQRLANDKDFRKLFVLYESTYLQADLSQTYRAKANLKKNKDDLILNNKLLNYIENQLTDLEKQDFEKELALDLQLRKELDLWLKTKLTAETAVVFPNKVELKKENKVVYLFSYRTITAIAASLILLMSLVLVIRYYFPFQNTTPLKAASAIPTQLLLKKAIESGSKPSKNIPELEGEQKSETVTIVFQANNKKVNVESPEESNNLANTKTEEHLAELEKISPDTTLSLANNVVTADTANNNLLAHNSDLEKTLNFLVPFESENEADEDQLDQKQKKGFWSFAAKLAKQANKAGIKAIDGNELNQDHYLLSFNSFSVEKK